MSHLTDLLKEMRGRVPMYVGSNSLAKLADFVRGFAYASQKVGKEQADSFLPGFQEFVRSRYTVTISKAWEEIILFQSADEREAMDLFWQLFDEYCLTQTQASAATDK